MNKSPHPYKQFQNTPTWRALDQGLKDLVKNGDVEELTTRQHIVGYLAKVLADAGVSVSVPAKPMKVVELRGDEQLIVRARRAAG